MKTFITALLLILPITAFADDFGAKIPEWKDFVPTAFMNVKEPKGVGKLNVTAAYWYQRRIDFESGLEECKAFANNDERFTCYENLKVKQFKENTDYNARVEAHQQSSAIQEMNSMQDTMMPINHYLQNIGRFQPNEFR